MEKRTEGETIGAGRGGEGKEGNDRSGDKAGTGKG